ncbi:peroxiredoxin-1-like [Hylaeus volcanicus]|uniref:peroxiredoxin-1-like n=1 Tax=Hylaeus volcanicus TaxID=313075 RepID=UPI0023B860EC|nr:peroxiredoxin-1-like [Hylaeus volcanicus]
MMSAEGSHEIQVRYPAPVFKGTAVMPDGSFQDISLSDFKGSYVVLYFYPLNFTFVCPSEILAFDAIVNELKARNTVLIGCSVDSHFSHNAWRNTEKANGGIGRIQHMLLSDITKTISRDYGVLLKSDGIALRGLFLIDKEGILRHKLVNDLPLGRSSTELLRMVDSLQQFEEVGEVCPANWKKGAPTMKPTQEGVQVYLSRN